MIFQNAVYNKTYFDLFDKGMMNWKGQSGNMIAITMITMFLPVFIVLILHGIFGATVTYSFMLIVGMAFVLTHKYWLKWTYKRFLKRTYKNMEGFRSNA
jgi:CBS domain containing-hemolysin-like protein